LDAVVPRRARWWFTAVCSSLAFPSPAFKLCRVSETAASWYFVFVHGESDCAAQRKCHREQGNYFMRGSIYHTKPV
jgi:hypothetical protein